MTDENAPVVLIVEDEESVAEGYELWLGDRYETRRAADGQEALDVIDDTVDVVLLDRMMPERSGAEVLREIRDRGIDCRVAMVTAVEADFDVIGMGFDAYVTKPPDREELTDTIERLLDRAAADDSFQEYHSLMARKGALEAQKTGDELAESEAYGELLDDIETARAGLDEDLGDLTSEAAFVGAVQDLAASAGDPDGEWLDDGEPDADGEPGGVDR
jgi:DNA-binding response OmpR family regulator